mgnify:FL=1
MKIIEYFFKLQNYILITLGIGEVIFIRKKNVNINSYSNFVKQATINGC